MNRMFDKTVDTQRLSDVSGSLKEEWQNNLTDLPCAIQPLGDEDSNFGDGAFYRSFRMWCAVDADIQTGDRVIDGSTIYSVKGVGTHNFGVNGVQHKSVSLMLGK